MTRDTVSVSPSRNTIAIPNTERLIGGAGASAKSMTVETRYEERTDADNIPPLPEALEQKIKINKDAETLGVQVDIEEGGVNGMVVRSVTRGGTLARDGRIQPGDYLVAVNSENMRGVSHSQALAVLRQEIYKIKLDWESIRSSLRDGFGVVGTLGFGD